jgi:hypothetical protein
MSIISFNKPQCLSHLTIIAILRSFKSYIVYSGEDYLKNNALNRIFIVYISYFSSIIFYIFQKIMFSNIKNTQNYYYDKYEKQIIKKYFFWIFFIMFIAFITTTFGEFKYRYFFYNYEMKKIKSLFLDHLKFFILFFSYFINEKYFLKIRFYRHHKLSLYLISLSLIIYFIIYLIKDLYKYKIKATISLLLIITLSQYIQSTNYIIAKKLNYEFFINMNLFLTIIGLLGLIIGYFSYNYFIYKIIYFSLFDYLQNEDFRIIIIYCLISSILYILEFKVVEETKPSYAIMGRGLSNLMVCILKLFYVQEKDKQEISSFGNICLSVVYILCFLIFSEIIIFNFWDLQKNTRYEISKRGVFYTMKDTNITSSSSIINLSVVNQ